MKHTFKGGVHPLHKIHEGKNITKDLPVAEMDAPAKVVVPMSQHIGAPAKACVAVGDTVKIGQVIGEPQGFVSVPVHSSVAGKVSAIGQTINIMGKPVAAVTIDNDFTDEAVYMPPLNYESSEPKDILDRIKNAGMVGMGGATFPTHVKLSLPPGKSADYLLINAAECEPFLTSDYREMLDHPDKIITGIKIVMRALGVGKAIIGVEDNKPDAAQALKGANDTPGITVELLQTKYPQGGEKQLIEVLTGRQVPSGKLPIDAGAVVVNVTTASAIADAFLKGIPLTRRVVTVTGALKKPGNYDVRIGTSARELLNYAGGFSAEPKKIISGGPMMGLPVPTLECAVTKGFSGLLVLDSTLTKIEKRSNCIRCGKCGTVCPIHLRPAAISQAAEGDVFGKCEALHAMDCISCGCCSFVCPAKIPIAQNIKFAKDQITIGRMRDKMKREAEAQKENTGKGSV